MGFLVNSFSVSAVNTDTTKTYDHIGDTGNNYWNLHNSNIYAVIKMASGCPAIGTYVQKFKVSIRKVGAPASTFEAGIWNASDTKLVSTSHTCTTFLTTSYADYEFDMGSPYLIAENFKIGIEYQNGTGVPNRIDVETITETVETGYLNCYATLNSDNTNRNQLQTFDSDPTA